MLRGLLRKLLTAPAAPRALVEQVVGMLGHLCTIVAEGKVFLDAGYALLFAKRRTREGRVHLPAVLGVGGDGPRATRFRDSLRWFDGVLAAGTSAHLAPRSSFPSLGNPGSAFFFGDASREWGVGGWSLVAGDPPSLLLLAARYPPDLQAAARASAGGLSTGALELAAAEILTSSLRSFAPFSSLIVFTDSEATRGAINSGGSASAVMRSLLLDLFKSDEQLLAVRVTTSQNLWADQASRGDAAAVAAAARALGWRVERRRVGSQAWEPLRAAFAVQQAEGEP